MTRKSYIYRDHLDEMKKIDADHNSKWSLRPDIAKWCEKYIGYIPRFYDPDLRYKPRQVTQDMAISFRSAEDFVMFKMKWL
jgi:hypothetical protein